MSKSSEIKGKKNSKGNNFTSARKYRKHVPYGSTRQNGYDSDDGLTGIVNKSKERQKAKLHLKNIISQISEEKVLDELEALEDDIFNN